MPITLPCKPVRYFIVQLSVTTWFIGGQRGWTESKASARKFYTLAQARDVQEKHAGSSIVEDFV